MRERIKKVMKDNFKLKDIPDNISQKNCSVWDSLHHLQLVVGLETEFNISIEPEDIAEMQSIEDIEKVINNYCFYNG